MVPTTFDEWKHCIVEKCKIKLTKHFVANRLKVYENSNNPETRQFVALYGEQHLNNVIYWLKKASTSAAQ
ncbi:MAG: hypothetical protein AAF798_04355 [Bacteroidota bacterium]